jgi:hypothetical protein
MRRKIGASVMSMSILLFGCSGMGARPVLTRSGVVADEVEQSILTSGPIYNFVQAERRARPYPTNLATDEQTEAANVERRDNPAANREMLEAGFTAIYASCDDFFRSSGRDQTRLLVLRDIIVALTSIAGGAIALVDGNNEGGGTGNENALSLLALGSTAALSGVDIYTQRFLFGAENIDAVRELTTRALDTHRTGVLNQNPTTYDRVLIHLMDNQAKCSPRAISRLARDAIAAGNLTADAGTGSVRTQQNQTQDQAVLEELGRILDAGGSLTGEQAEALWWLLMTEGELAPKDEEISGAIATALAGLPEDRRPIDEAGQPRDAWPPAEAVRQLLRRLSEPTQRAFRLQIAAARAGNSPESAVADSQFRLQSPVAMPAPSSDRRVTVRVVPAN